MIKSLCRKASTAALLFAVQAQVFADIYNPTGDSGSESDLTDKVDNIYDIVALIIGSIFGLVAVVSLSIIAFTFFKDREKAMEQLWGWGGAVLLFSSVTAIVSLIFSAVA